MGHPVYCYVEENINVINKNAEVLLDASKEVYLKEKSGVQSHFISVLHATECG